MKYCFSQFSQANSVYNNFQQQKMRKTPTTPDKSHRLLLPCLCACVCVCWAGAGGGGGGGGNVLRCRVDILGTKSRHTDTRKERKKCCCFLKKKEKEDMHTARNMNIPKKVTHTWLLTTTRTTACWAVPRGIFPRQLHAKTTWSVSRLLLSL